MRIHDILHTKGSDVVVIEPTASVRDLVTLLRDHNLGALVVSSDGATVEGIVSERDVIRALADGVEFIDGPVTDIMTPVVHTCTPEDHVQSLMATMTEARVRHIPVLDGHSRLSGIVSIGDVVKSTIDQLQFERDQLEGYVTR
jgi:CBS domain-containing protein